MGGWIGESFSMRGGAGSAKTRAFPLDVVCWATATAQASHNPRHETKTGKVRRRRRGMISRIRPRVAGTALFGGAHSNGQDGKNKDSTRGPDCRGSGTRLTRRAQTRAEQEARHALRTMRFLVLVLVLVVALGFSTRTITKEKTLGS